jgi:hypothetical protein
VFLNCFKNKKKILFLNKKQFKNQFLSHSKWIAKDDGDTTDFRLHLSEGSQIFGKMKSDVLDAT